MSRPRVLILACGALAVEIRAITRLHEFDNITLECLPASLHNRPDQIPDAVQDRLERARGNYDRVLVGYADCGTAGRLADLAEREGVEMLPGAHCYQVYAGHRAFDAMHEADPTAFYLTDYLVKHFDRIVLDGLGITDHPELRDIYFAHYTKLIYLAQSDDPHLDAKAQACAEALGLTFERRSTSYGDLAPSIVSISVGAVHA